MKGMTGGVVAMGEDIGEKFVDTDRYRVQALFANPFDYGYICVITFLFHLYAYTVKLETKKVLILVTSCCLFGIILCGCRTILFVFVISFIVYCLLAFKEAIKESTTQKPILWRLFLYFSPILPKPTIKNIF